jgi:hypothetical protein
MDRWLARLAMSFFIIAAVLVWEAYLGFQRGLSEWRIIVNLVAAAGATSLGIAGIRVRHRRR